MRRIILAAVAVIAALAFNAPPALAREAPWCGVIEQSRNNVYWDCRYNSFETCVSNVIAGQRGFCNQNPNYVGESGPAKKGRIHHKRHPS
jgi:hypothetical protein